MDMNFDGAFEFTVRSKDGLITLVIERDDVKIGMTFTEVASVVSLAKKLWTAAVYPFKPVFQGDHENLKLMYDLSRKQDDRIGQLARLVSNAIPVMREHYKSLCNERMQQAGFTRLTNNQLNDKVDEVEQWLGEARELQEDASL